MSDPWSFDAVRARVREGGGEVLSAAELYLVRAVGVAGQEGEDLAFRTELVKLDRELPSWVLRPLSKRAGNPFPERLSVGRAPNCDVVLRFRFVSKLHAHVHVTSDGYVVSDNGSANGTWVNGVALPRGERLPIAPGDELRLGSLPLAVMTPRELLALLAKRAS